MADQPVKFNPVGNMDKDADPRYVRQGNYLDAKNIQKLTEKGGTGGAVIPVKGNQHAFDLGNVTAQNKKYRIQKGQDIELNIVAESFELQCKSGFVTGINITTVGFGNFASGLSVGDYITFDGPLGGNIDPEILIQFIQGSWQVTSIVDTNTFTIGNPLLAVGPLWDLQIPCSTQFQLNGVNIILANYQLQFWSMNDDQIMSTVYTDGSISGIMNAINASPLGLGGLVSVTTSFGLYVDVELTVYNYYDWILRSVGDNFLSVYPIQEAIPKNVEGPLKANGSCDILGDLFITSTTTDLEPQKLDLTVIHVLLTNQNTAVTEVEFNAPHGLQAGEWIGISNSNAHWLNGVFLVDSVPSSTEINIVTAIAWQSSGTTYDAFPIGEEVIHINPKSIGEIGVGTYNHYTDVWTYTRLLRSMELNFRMEHANDISGRDDIRRKTLYYTDDYNNRRAFYYYGDYQNDGALYFINTDNFYFYDLIDQQSEISAAQISTDITLHAQQAGGSIDAGNKRYFCYLVDFFGNRSAYSYLSNIVSAYSDPETGRAGGDLTGVNTGKMNQLLISDIDQRMYQYISLGYIDYVGDVIVAYTLSEVDITGNQMVMNHFGSETAITVDLAEIPISLLKLPKKALSVDVIDNRLVFSNLQEEPKRDIRDWAKTFQHRIKEEWINESNSFTPANEYQNVQTIHDKLGYMIDDTYRFGVQVRWKDSGIWSEAAWVDDISMHFRTNNDGNPFGDNRRIQQGNDVLKDYDLNKFIYDGFGEQLKNPLDSNSNPWNSSSGPLSGTIPRKAGAAVKVVYPEFFGFDFTYEIEGEPLSNLIDKIKIVRAECIPEVICNGALVLSVGLGSPGSNDDPILGSGDSNRPDFRDNTPIYTTELGSQLPNGVIGGLDTTLFPVSYYQNGAQLYNAIIPAIILSQNDSDPDFNWVNFEGTFHEYPFAAHPPSQAGSRPLDQKIGGFAGSPALTDPYLSSWKQYGFYSYHESDVEIYDWSLSVSPSTTSINGTWNNYARVFRERGLNYNDPDHGTSPGYGWGATNAMNTGSYGGPAAYQFGIGNYGYPDFEFRGHNPMYNTCPLYHYGEDANPDEWNSGGYPDFTGDYRKFTGTHGQPFGTRVVIANNGGASSALSDTDSRFYPSRRLFYPFWVNRRIVSFYSPDVMLGLQTVTASAELKVFGEFRLNRSHVGDYATINAQESNVNGISGYTEYWVDGMGTYTVNYDIQNVVEIGDGGASEVYPTARFRKGISAMCNGYTNKPTEVFGDKAKKHEQYNNLWTNPTGPVLQIDGSANLDNVDGLNGLLPQQKNTDYGVYYGQIFQANRGKYGPTGDAIYIDTGKSFKVDSLSMVDVIPNISNYSVDSVDINQIKVFGGDAFTQGFYLANRKINPSFKTEEGNWNFEHFIQAYNSDDGYDEAGPSTPMSPGFGSGMKFYSQNRVNAQMRADDSDSFVFPKDGPLSAWLNEDEFGFGTDFRYNSSYTPKNGVLSYSSINDRLLKQQTDLPSRIDYSEKYDQQTIDDRNQSFLPLNFKDIDQTFGEIISHKNVNGELFTLQPRKLQAQYFHATGQLQTDVAEGMNIVIGDGAVLARDGQTLSSYGTQHKWSVIKGRSPGGKDVLYWFNQESKLIMRFGADGTVVLSDVKGLRSFLENDTRWTEGIYTPYVNQGIRAVWDDEYKEAIWTWRGYRASRGMWKEGLRLDTYNEYDTVANLTFTNYPFEQIPDVYVCIQTHNPTEGTEPGGTGRWRQFWVLVPKDDGDYYSNFTLAFNEMTNGFSSFYSHMPKIYFPWKNKFLSAHPTIENKIYEHRKGEYTTWYTTGQYPNELELSEDGYLEGIINYLPESSKKFVATQVISDSEPYKMEFKTLNQESFLNEGEFDGHDDHWRSPIKNDSTDTNDPSGDTKSLMGDFIKVKFFFQKKMYNRLYNFVVKLRERLRIYRS